MSILHYHQRPWVAFDATNLDHRRWFAEFQSSRTWGRCPVRFIIADEQGDLITMIQRRLIQYYVDCEFRLPVDSNAKNSRLGNISQQNKSMNVGNQKAIELSLND